MNFNPLNLKEVCRLCLGTASKMKPLISTMPGDNRTLLEVLSFATGIKIIQNEDFPNQICEDCVVNIRIANTLKTKCEKSQDMLASLAVSSNHPIKTEHEENSCDICKIHFRSSFDNINHKNCHLNPYQCSICLTKYSNSEMLELHLGNSHSHVDRQLKKFECTNCERTFSSNKDFLDSHCKACFESKITVNDDMMSADNNTYDTDYNDYKLEIEEHLTDQPTLKSFELKSKTLNNAEVCSKCFERFDTKKELKQHMKETHTKVSKVIRKKKHRSKKINKADSSLMLDLKSESDILFKKVGIEVKTEVSNGPIDIIPETDAKKMLKKVPYNCVLCNEKFSKKYAYLKHLKSHEAKGKGNYVCSICKREFIHKAHLEKHILSIHASEGSFKCEYCTLSFSTQDLLNIHVNNHKDMKKHKCEFCDKGFNMLSTLKDHVRTHTGEKPYLCATCGRGFSQKTNLKEHMRRHSGFKPFACSNCDQKFVSKGELQAHMRKHTGAHPFVCSVCDAKFTTSSSLVKHKRIHTGERPYLCEHCTMRFSTLGTLKNHRRTHTGEKPYKCMLCEKAFAQRNDLTTHLRCHTGERPYICSTCGQAFKQSSALKTHQKLHTMKDGSSEPVQLMLKKKFYDSMDASSSISPDIASCASISENTT